MPRGGRPLAVSLLAEQKKKTGPNGVWGPISSCDVPQGTYGGGLKRILVPHKKRIDCRMHSILCPSLSLASCRVSWSQRVLRSLKKIWRTARHFLRVSPLFPYRPLAFFYFSFLDELAAVVVRASSLQACFQGGLIFTRPRAHHRPCVPWS